MSYDLTAFLTTVAASSASIVAILGGFIASKLISISGEREVLLDKMNSVDEELRFKKAELEKRQKVKDICDALFFIQINIEAVCKQEKLDIVYDPAENYGISKECVAPYWDKALSVCRAFFEMDPKGAELNLDGVPKELACKYSNDTFSYDVLRILMQYKKKVLKEEERRKHEEARKKDPFARQSLLHDIVMNNTEYFRPLTLTAGYTQNEQEITKLASNIKLLEFQREQLKEQKKTLTKPKGMMAGLIIFAVFAIACIITPLALSPRYTESLCTFWIIKTTILVLFILGLVAIFGYLVYLLQWKNNPIKKENKD